MIHMSRTNAAVVENKAEVEVVDVMRSEVVNTEGVINTENRIIRRSNRPYSHKTFFEGNGRTLLWDGLGEDVSAANSAYEVCKIAGLDYNVKTEAIYTADGVVIPNMVATRRYDQIDEETEVPSTVYGVVTNRYMPVQNYQGFEFIDSLFGHNGFQVETAGQFNDGKIVWVEAKLPEKVMVGEKICPYLVFTNRHDGKGSVRIFLSPVRVICKNTLNMAIKGAKDRTFAVKHTSSANTLLEQAKMTLNNYYEYLDAMENAIDRQKRIMIEDRHLDQLLNNLIQFKEDDTDKVKERAMAMREEVRQTYLNAPDLDGYEKSGFRFINAVSDWATHHRPARLTENYRNNLFQKTLAGNEYIDKAVDLIDSMDTKIQIAV